MEVLEERLNQRRAIFDTYYDVLNKIEGFQFQPELENSKSNRWLTALTIDSEKTRFTAKTLIEYLHQHNIEARPVWKPMHLQPLYEGYEYIFEKEDNAKKLFETGVCLPSGSNMTEEQLSIVIEHINKLAKQYN